MAWKSCWLILHVTIEITALSILCTIVIVLYLTLALPLAHSNSTIDDVI